jgi:hypothetical protein
MNGIKFHSKVMTPNGPGIVQGRLHRKNKPDALLVSHQPELVRPAESRGGEAVSTVEQPRSWSLFAYEMESIQPLEARR